MHATGSAIDRALGIPGEDLPGSIGSGRFVGWYCGHPDHGDLAAAGHPGVAVVGAGNVALDVARVLARTADELAATDVPDTVLDALRASAVRDVHVLIRRGPQHVKFTPVELRQLGDLADAEVVVHDDGLLAAGRPGRRDRPAERANLAVARRVGATPAPHRQAAPHPPAVPAQPRADPRRRRPRHRHRRRAQRDRRTAASGARGRSETLDVGLVVRASATPREPIPGLPFDPATGTVPNVAGRVVRDGAPVPGGTSPAGSSAARPA